MSCPTCTHTMERLPCEDRRIFQCPRCGTTKVCDPYDHLISDTYVPTLVERVVAMLNLRTVATVRNVAEAVGVREADIGPKPRFSLDTIDGKIEAADLQDDFDRQMLYDALLEVGRDEEAKLLMEDRPAILVKDEVDGRLFVFEIPF